MNGKFIHSREAIWTCDLYDVLGAEGRLRSALIVVTPFTRYFREFVEYRRRPQREEEAVAGIRDLYLLELWYRRPRVIESPDEGLVTRLKELPLRPSFRHCEANDRLMMARHDFARRCATRRRPRYYRGA